jgi:hypothetical protein
VDLAGDARPCAVELRRDVPNDSIWAVKSRSRFVVSFSLYARRGVGEGVRSERRTVEGVFCARARGVAYCVVSVELGNCYCMYLTSRSPPFRGLFCGLLLSMENFVMSKPGISEKSLKQVSSISADVVPGLSGL